MTELERLCKISLCDPEVTTDADALCDNSGAFSDPSSSSKGFVAELSAKNVRIIVSTGQTINEDDIIAYMDDLPLRSIMKAKIVEVNPRYIIGEYIKEDPDTIVERVNSIIDEYK
jgi:hypothetical protein